MPDSGEAPLGGAKAVEGSSASTAQKAGILVPSLPPTKHQRRAAPHGSPHPWGRRVAARAEKVAAAASLPS